MADGGREELATRCHSHHCGERDCQMGIAAYINFGIKLDSCYGHRSSLGLCLKFSDQARLQY